jgi:hypothetical protein
MFSLAAPYALAEYQRVLVLMNAIDLLWKDWGPTGKSWGPPGGLPPPTTPDPPGWGAAAPQTLRGGFGGAADPQPRGPGGAGAPQWANKNPGPLLAVRMPRSTITGWICNGCRPRLSCRRELRTSETEVLVQT